MHVIRESARKRERESERERDREGGRERGRQREREGGREGERERGREHINVAQFVGAATKPPQLLILTCHAIFHPNLAPKP